MIKRNDSERYILSLDNGGTYIKAALYTEKVGSLLFQNVVTIW